MYAHLMDASLIVRRLVHTPKHFVYPQMLRMFTSDLMICRHPAQWLLLPEEDASCIWLMAGTPNAAQSESMTMQRSSSHKVTGLHPS